MIVPASCKPVGGFIVKGDVHLIVLKFGIAPAPCAALFPVEHVNGNVLGTKALEPVQILAPNLVLLVRQTRNEIYADVFETGPAKRFEIVENVCRTVQATGILEILIA